MAHSAEQRSKETWSESLDALTAAPAHHRLLLENESVRVLETSIHPGDRTAVHTHRWRAVQYVLSWSNFIRRDGAGNVLLDSRTVQAPDVGAAIWSEPLLPHSVENVGAGELRVLVVEMKTPEK